jgi:hypothetical protein
MARYAVDWGQNPEKLVILEDVNGKPRRVKHDGRLFEFIKTLKNGDSVYLESPFEPYHRTIHNEIVDYAVKNGIAIFVINPRETANERMNQGIVGKDDDDTLDKEDAKILFQFMVEKKKHFASPRPWEIRDETWQDAINSERRIGWPSGDTMLAKLPPAKSVPDVHKDALLNGTIYSDGFVIPVVWAATETKKEGGNRDDFERYLGNYGNGYPSYLRATFYRRVRTLDQRALEVKSFKKAGIVIIRDYPDVHKTNMKKVRKACRWLFSQVE